MPARSQAEVQRRRELFIRAFATHGSPGAAAVAAGYSPKQPDAQGAKMMADPEVGPRARAARDAWVSRQVSDFDRQALELVREADAAIATLAEVSRGPQPDAEGKLPSKWSVGAMARVQAAVAILDRAGHKPVERVEQTMRWEDAARDIPTIDVSALLNMALEEVRHEEGALPGAFRALTDESQGGDDA